MPFFAYDFYTFEYRSATVAGTNPNFGSTKTFEVDANNEFDTYMRNQVLKIDLMDEGASIKISNDRDYIGSVRIPLTQVFHKGISQST